MTTRASTRTRAAAILTAGVLTGGFLLASPATAATASWPAAPATATAPSGSSGPTGSPPTAARILTGTYLGFTASDQTAAFRLVITKSSRGYRFRADTADYTGTTFNTTRGTVRLRSNNRLLFRLTNGITVTGVYIPRLTYSGVASRGIRLSTCTAMFSYALDRVYRCQFVQPR